MLALLAACGTTSNDPAANGTNSVSNETGNETANETKTITISHALGDTEITGIPKRIVALDFRYVEELTALGITPVGVGDFTGYENFVGHDMELLKANAIDVGKRSEPNLELIVQLKPDLIIGNSSFMGENYKLLNDIAPTLAFEPYPDAGLDQYEEMEQTFLKVASAVDKQAEAEQVLADLNGHYEELKQTLAEHGKGGAPFVLGLLRNNNDAASVRLYARNAQASGILQKLGLNLVFHSEEAAAFGTADSTVEALAAYQDANFLYMLNPGQETVVTDLFKNNPVWSSLKFVQEGRAYPMEKYVWQFGGPQTAREFADLAVKAIIS
nr:iron-siderophore ABC transporter substrate-binding protein [Paenibacillus roseus]